MSRGSHDPRWGGIPDWGGMLGVAAGCGSQPLVSELGNEQREWTASGLTECATRRRCENVMCQQSATPCRASLATDLDSGQEPLQSTRGDLRVAFEEYGEIE
jgi:hypothetical protein